MLQHIWHTGMTKNGLPSLKEFAAISITNYRVLLMPSKRRLEDKASK